MQEEDDYSDLCAEIAQEIVSIYEERTGKKLRVVPNPYGVRLALDLDFATGVCEYEITSLTFFRPGYVSVPFSHSQVSPPTMDFCVADPRFFEKITDHLAKIVKQAELTH